MGWFAEVAVDASTPPGKTYTYRVPPGTALAPGQVVWVPLGPRPVQGVVWGLSPSAPAVPEVRPVLGPVDPLPLLSPPALSLARWLSETYLAPLFACARLFLPPGLHGRAEAWLWPAPDAGPEGPDEEAGRLLRWLTARAPVRLEAVRRAYGRRGERVLQRLLARGQVVRQWRLPRPRVGPRYEAVLVRTVDSGPGRDLLSALDRAPRQQALLEYLLEAGEVPLRLARKEFGASAVMGLRARGLADVVWRRRLRDPFAGLPRLREASLPLTPEQAEAVRQVENAMEEGRYASFLLQGPTGSGKTEVYLRAVEACLRRGRRALYLVPEIALASQAVQRLLTRFPGEVAVLHSGLSPGEQWDQWWRIRQGEGRVVVGTRSALFAPLKDLGLIVLDEEQEPAYKQEEPPPRYHARETALQRARLEGAVVLMGSATPDVETRFRAERGEHRLLRLPHRLVPADGGVRPAPLPEVEVVDMREELRAGNRGLFSRALRSALAETLERGEQALLFLNRRGSAPVVVCRDCGHTLTCRRCEAGLVYHREGDLLRCHLCGDRRPVPPVCPACTSPRIRYLGVGTQRVAEEVQRLFPGVRVLRWDRDTARREAEHRAVLARFASGEAQVLVGTQMVAKGLHLPRVTLVGVVLAEVGLGLPDFRAGERTFQLLCQVAGRAGRGERPGRVVVQTYRPDHPAVRLGALQDYESFYRQEVAFRQAHRYPPFARLVRLVHRHPNPDACREGALALAERLRERLQREGRAEVDLLGPAPAFPERVRGRYRWQVLVRGPNPLPLLRDLALPDTWAVDVDPQSLTER